MRSLYGISILTLGAAGAVIAYWWAGLSFFFVGEALGVLTDRTFTRGLLAVGGLAGCTAGLLAGSTTLLGIHLLAVRPPKKLLVFLVTWGAWTILGGIDSALLQNAFSPVMVASMLGVCHLIVCVLYVVTERVRTR